MYGLLTAAEVLRLRERLRLSQRAFARLLGWSPATVNRYERVGCQSEAHNQVLLTLTSAESAQRLLTARAPALETMEQIQFAQALQRITVDAVPALLISDAPANYGSQSLSRLTAILARLADGRAVFGTHVLRLLFYADFAHARDHGSSISGFDHVHGASGPILRDWDIWLPLVRRNGLATFTLVEGEDWAGETIVPRVPYRADDFLPSEHEVLARVVAALGGLKVRGLGERVRSEPLWLETTEGAVIDITQAARLLHI